MIKIVIGNSVCRVEGISIGEFKALRGLLSYTIDPKSAFFSGATGFNRRYLIGKRGEFPTGLLYLVEDYFKAEGKAYRKIDNRSVPKPLTEPLDLTLGITPHEWQKEASRACKRFTRGIVSAPTGTGKSIVAAMIINAVQVRTLLVVPTLELKKQLTESLKAAFGHRKVGDIRQGRIIAVENVDALDPNERIDNYDCVIIDEFHHSGAATYRKLNKKAWSGIYYKFGLTATPFRSKSEERLLLESVLSQVIYRLDYRTAVDKGYIVPIEAYYYEVPTTAMKGNPKSWASVYSELVVKNTKRNKLISELLTNLNNAKISTLCLVKEIPHGKALAEYSQTPFVCGEDKESREHIGHLNSKTISALVGTTGVLGEGVDTKPVEYVIIAGLGKSRNALMQQAGRGVRRFGDKQSCKIIIFKDKSHKFCLRHFKEQCKILREEYGIEPIRLELNAI